jgi:DNA (cytosine-5)-methyltransferase 1
MKVLELFAGIGSWSKGLNRLDINYEVVDAVEIDEKTIQCYNAIHDTNFVAKDISSIKGKEYGRVDVVCYSPPCQSWSKSGDRGGFADDRGKLFYDSLRIIKETKPKFAIMENVKNLTSPKFKKDLETMLLELENAGYTNYHQVINATDLNFPQHRERIFIVSIRKDIKLEYKFPEKTTLTKSFSEYLEDNWDKKYLHSEKGIAYMNRVTTKNRTHWDFGHHNDTDKQYSMCIVQNFKKGVPYNVLIDRRNGEYIRKHTSLEVLRLMGFDDIDHKKLKDIKISDSQIYIVAGNSIVVDVCEKILGGIFNG